MNDQDSRLEQKADEGRAYNGDMGATIAWRSGLIIQGYLTSEHSLRSHDDKIHDN